MRGAPLVLLAPPSISRKFRKNAHFWEKILLPTAIFLRYLYQGAETPPLKNISLVLNGLIFSKIAVWNNFTQKCKRLKRLWPLETFWGFYHGERRVISRKYGDIKNQEELEKMFISLLFQRSWHSCALRPPPWMSDPSIPLILSREGSNPLFTRRVGMCIFIPSFKFILEHPTTCFKLLLVSV